MTEMTNAEAQAIGEMLKRKEMRFEWMDPNQLTPNSFNWKEHPAFQRRALRAFREELEGAETKETPESMATSWVGALLYNERTGRLLDGHMRQEEAIERGETRVPVLIVDLDEVTETKVLFYLDRVGAMYKEDNELNEKIAGFLADNVENDILAAILRDEQAGKEEKEEDEEEQTGLNHKELPPGGLALSLGQKFDYVVLMFRTEMDWTAAQDHFGLTRQKCPFSSNTGVGRVVDGAKYLKELGRKMNGQTFMDEEVEKARALLAAE